MKYLVAAMLSFASGAVLLKVFMDKAKKSGEWYAQCPLCGQAHKVAVSALNADTRTLAKTRIK